MTIDRKYKKTAINGETEKSNNSTKIYVWIRQYLSIPILKMSRQSDRYPWKNDKPTAEIQEL